MLTKAELIIIMVFHIIFLTSVKLLLFFPSSRIFRQNVRGRTTETADMRREEEKYLYMKKQMYNERRIRKTYRQARAAGRKGKAMKRQTRCGMMESLVEERKKEMEKERALEGELQALLRKKEALLQEGSDKEALAGVEEEISRIALEMEESLKTRKNLCSLARVVGAGD